MTVRAFVALAFGLAALLAVVSWTSVRARRRLRRRVREQVGLAPRSDDDGRTSGRVNRRHRKISSRRRRRRSESIDEQLSPALQLVIGHLRIGRNVISALGEVATATPEPLGPLLAEVVAESRLGTPVDEVIQRVADEAGNRHLGVVASAIGLHTRHGGSLVEILETVVDSIEEEDRLRRDIKSLTADGRLSAKVLLAMPPTMLVFVTATSPGYAAPLVDTALGRVLSFVGVVLGVSGWLWLRAIGNPKVVA